MSEGFNANPTIRNASDLPSRRRQGVTHQTSSKGALGLLTSTIPLSAYIPDPFSQFPASPDQESTSQDDEVTEPIDEQEIYGLHHLRIFTTMKQIWLIHLDYRPHLLNRRS